MNAAPGDVPYLTMVVPVYNGAARLAANLCALSAFLEAQAFTSELIVVDDGSAPAVASVLERFSAGNAPVTVLRNPTNRGKGASVRRGMLAGRGRYRVFLDSDLSYPPAEVSTILSELEAGADVAIACRVLPDSRYEMSPSFFHYLYTRHLMSRAFNHMVRIVMLRGVLDTQAGLKGFSARAAETVFSRVTIPRFGFDVEALYVAQKHRFTIRQTAVHFRYDDEPTTVRFVRSAVTMAADLLEVKLNDWRGRYD